ncbi:TonB-dependent receptor [Sphingomonas sp. 10B4]|uniref:TonB-dependent receptor n=1 Tax=Sphingomonas sp. 10B4 TaxID=3048575 RepID=UPI002AB3E0CA|nr:TonB-dependent receptor [Sphingomonas sp. 10B4]MDY7525562.1 TonB-dependent receptor [Sphingomonas sp. 10B4]MEB0282575.1 TonB-dependent receptor [Sphingomonas sp. 10B4]
MVSRTSVLGVTSFCAMLASPTVPAFADERASPAPDSSLDDILVTAQRRAATIENAPSSKASIDAATIATTINARNVEDTLKYLPSLVVRKRHIGDSQAPLATRTSGLGASARSLIYADGAILSALIGNNNTSASPRWSLVSTEEIARVDVLYGPFSAAYPGNAIGAVVNITTRLPDSFEGTLVAGTTVQQFDLYGTHRTLPAYQLGGTFGDRFGPLAVFGSVDHVDSRGQPIGFASATATKSATSTPTTGGYDDVNRTGGAIRVVGATAFEHQVQDRLKLKAALDLSAALRLTYVGSLFLSTTDSTVESYLTNPASGLPFYAGTTINNGRIYTLAASAFAGSVYRTEQRQWSHNLSLNGSGARFDCQVIGTLYDVDNDQQRISNTALPAVQTGGAGFITDLAGTGWKTLDAKGAWRSDAAATHTVSFGAHADWYELDSNRYNTSDWVGGSKGALNLQGSGKTRTYALWAQDAWRILPPLTLTLGGRYEWWRAYDGVNFAQSPAIGPVRQPALSSNRFSPKAALAYAIDPHLTARLSFGQAWRFPTVGELYQIVTTPVASVPNPNLRPERARSLELALERQDSRESLRFALFNEVIRDALISQTGPLAVTPVQVGTYVQNVDETRARGAELSVARTNVVGRVDVSGSVTYADAITSKNAVLPGAVGKLLPSVPRWKATAVATWRPVEGVALTAAARYASRNYGALDNSDVVGNTYQGFYRYFVVDLRAQFRVAQHIEFGIGVDNVNNDRYFLFHPFPQRSFAADVKVTF